MENEDFDRLLKIARLSLDEAEKKRIKADIEEILKYFEEISSIKVDELPSYQPIEIPGRLREDEIIEFKEIDAMLGQTKRQGKYVRGPRI